MRNSISLIFFLLAVSCGSSSFRLNNTFSGYQKGYTYVLTINPDSSAKYVKTDIAWPTPCLGLVSQIEAKVFEIKCSIHKPNIVQVSSDDSLILVDKPQLVETKVDTFFVINSRKIKLKQDSVILKTNK